jgi:hypothetical protein
LVADRKINERKGFDHGTLRVCIRGYDVIDVCNV